MSAVTARSADIASKIRSWGSRKWPEFCSLKMIPLEMEPNNRSHPLHSYSAPDESQN